MTKRLYFDDAFLREFEARVLSCEPLRESMGKGSAGYRVVLDATAFYPTSGGQPHDTGMLGDARVVEVVEQDDGTIVHLTDREVAVGSIRGRIDWPRRFDHMQQHTGQHLLSAAFLELFGFPTVSFHLGRDASTIDLATAGVSGAQLAEAERLTNQVIFEDRAVRVRYGTATELAAFGVRKQVNPELAGRVGPNGILRAIEIEEFDRQPCGGTHVARTGQVGLVLVRKLEKQKQNWRVEFVCGERALRAARADAAVLTEAARLLSCGAPDLPAVLQKALDERQAMHRACGRMLEELAVYEAADLRQGTKQAAGSVLVVARVFDGHDAGRLRLLAKQLVLHGPIYALLATRAGGHVVFAQSPGLERDMAALLREAIAPAGGKGGGTRDFAQGSVPDSGALEAVLERAQAQLLS
jgi:alanyl-tRNA synthetase